MKTELAPSVALSRILLVSTLLVGNPVLSPAQQAAQLHPTIATLTAGVDSLDKVSALYGKGAETTVQDIHSLCYYVEQDQAYLSIASFEQENRIRRIAFTTFANVAPGCRSARIIGKHLTALGGISLGDSTAKITSALGSPVGNGKVMMGDHALFSTDYRIAGGQLSCEFENDKLVLIAVEVPAGRAPNREQTAIVRFVQRAAVRAVNFSQGDAAGFTASRGDFTDDAWKDFINHMQGFVDEKGSPTFTSSFVVSGPAKVLDERNGTVRFIIPGTLTQSSKLSKTTYRAVLEVSAGGEPLKIQKVEQIACTAMSPVCE
jgi:hypothetical protein